MHVTLAADSENALHPHLSSHSGPDSSWQLLRSGQKTLPQTPHLSDEDIQVLVDRLHEAKMLEQLQSLLSVLPSESQLLIEQLGEG